MIEFNRDVVNYAYLGDNKAVCVTNYGCRILIDTRNHQHFKIISHGFYEKGVAWAIQKYLKPDNVFIDIGANIGFFSLMANKIVGPKGKVVSLEPNPGIFQMLKTSININSFRKRCDIHNIAAFNTVGEMDLTWGTADHGGARLVTSEKVYLSENVTSVKLKPLDDILAKLDRPVDFIKIDTEGSEPYILDGAQNILKNNPNCVLVSEWTPRFIKLRGYPIEQATEFLLDTFSSIELIVKVGVTKKIGRDELLNIHHSNLILKQ